MIAWTDTRNGSEDIFLSVLFVPNGSFVTGSGRIMSTAVRTDADGIEYDGPPANFGFEAKYKKDSSTPVGHTEFSFAKGKSRFRFKSTSYDWFMIRGAKAQLKGSGTVNGSGDYSFLVVAIDGSQPGGDRVNRFRIKIADKTTTAVIYDSEPGAADDIAAQPLIEGDIEIRNKWEQSGADRREQFEDNQR